LLDSAKGVTELNGGGVNYYKLIGALPGCNYVLMMVLQIIMYTVGNVLDNDISKRGGSALRAMDLKRRKKFPNPPQASF